MNKNGVMSITIIAILALPILASLYAAQSGPFSHPMVPAPSPPGVSGAKVMTEAGCPLPSAQCEASYNWGGYAATGATSSVTQVTGSWTVPAVVGTTGTTCQDTENTWYDASIWIGIDGFTSSTVEQTGTSSDCYYGQAQYYAWYEFYPAGSVTITSVPVKAGDGITATVTFSSGKFTTTIKDTTTGKSFTSPATTVSGAKENSAEWIAESAYASQGILALTDFTSVTFTSATATISKVTKPISGWSPNDYWILMVDYNWPSTPTLAYAKAEPLTLGTGGNNFNANWLSYGP